MAQYQDIIINGKVKRGQRDCESRWEVIRKELKLRYDRPISVLDIGANFGYFSFRIQEEFPTSVSICIESKHCKKLIEICEKNNAEHTIVLDKLVTTEDLQTLANCEHFDVVLGLNVLHHIGDVRDSFDAIERLGNTTIIETPHPLDKGACGQKHLQYLFDKVTSEYNIIGEFSRHTSEVHSPLGIKDRLKTNTEKRYWDSKPYKNNIIIDSSKKEKKFRHQDKNESRDWIHGVNLRTYQYLNGQYPSRQQITEYIKQQNFDNHEDLNPWNLIITGKKIVPIDTVDKRHTKPTSNSLQKEKICNDLLGDSVKPIKYYKKL